MIFSHGQYLLAVGLALLTHVSLAYLLLAGAPPDAPSAGYPMAITLTATGSASTDATRTASKSTKPVPAPVVDQAVAPPQPPQEAPRQKPQQTVPKPPPKASSTSSAAIHRPPQSNAQPKLTPHHRDAAEVDTQKGPKMSSPPARGGLRDAQAAPLGGNAPPRYPNLARRRGYQGQVVVRVSVQASGAVGNAVISKSSGYQVLDEAALEAVKAWRFRPARRAGQAVNATLNVPVVFQLEKG